MKKRDKYTMLTKIDYLVYSNIYIVLFISSIYLI